MYVLLHQVDPKMKQWFLQQHEGKADQQEPHYSQLPEPPRLIWGYGGHTCSLRCRNVVCLFHSVGLLCLCGQTHAPMGQIHAQSHQIFGDEEEGDEEEGDEEGGHEVGHVDGDVEVGMQMG